MGASLSYDATLLGCYYLMLALLTRKEWNTQTAGIYTAACIFVNIAKPYLNLLWVLPIFWWQSGNGTPRDAARCGRWAALAVLWPLPC